MDNQLNQLYGKKQNLVYQLNEVSRKVKERTKPGEVPMYTPEEDAQFRAWDSELVNVSNTIANLEREAKINAEAAVRQLEAQSGNGDQKAIRATYSQQKSVLKKAAANGIEKLSSTEKKIYESIGEEAQAFERMLRYGVDALDENEKMHVNNLRAAYVENEIKSGERAQTVTTTGGGYTIPQGFNPDIIKSLKSVSPFFSDMGLGLTAEARSLFYFLETASGNDIPWPSVDDTSNTGELLGINSDAFGNTTDLVFGTLTMKAYKYSPKPMKVPYELLQDTGIDLPGLIAEMLGTRLGRIVNTHLTTGDNSNKPQGIVAGASLGKVSASATAITFNEVLDLVHSVDPAHRRSPSARFMFHDNILLALKKLTIGSSTNDSRPLWQPGYAVGAPDTIDGFQYLINQDMASALTTGLKVMLFGDMKKYAVRQAGPFRLKYLTERFADADQVAWVLFGRFDGRILDSAAIKYLETT